MREPRTATACAIWNVSLTVMIFPLIRMRSAPACCACSDNDSPTTPPNNSSQANFLITSSRPAEDPFFRCRGLYRPAASRARDYRRGAIMRPLHRECGSMWIQREAHRESDAVLHDFPGNFTAFWWSPRPAGPPHRSAAALTGVVSSQAEGRDGRRRRQRQARGFDDDR